MTFEEYTRHIDWSLTVGRQRTRQTARQAASAMRELRDPGERGRATARHPANRDDDSDSEGAVRAIPTWCLRSGAAPDFSSSFRLQADGCHLCELALEQLGSAIAPGGSYER